MKHRRTQLPVSGSNANAWQRPTISSISESARTHMHKKGNQKAWLVYAISVLFLLALGSGGYKIATHILNEVVWRVAAEHLDLGFRYGLPRTPEAPPGGYQGYLDCLKDPKCTRFPKKNASITSTLLHDYPGHPWHWTRQNDPDPLLNSKKDCNGNPYLDLYNQFHKFGYVVFESCSLKQSNLVDKVAEYELENVKDKVPRIQNAPNMAVKQLATDRDTMEFLEYLHGGRRLWPYQTLNFAKGTQQALHSDLVHFDTSPRMLMTAAWTAFEDMTPDNGPLKYIPKSHLYGTWDYDEIGFHHHPSIQLPYSGNEQILYGQELHRIATQEAGLKEDIGSKVKKGQTFVWAAALVHGGSKQIDPKATRLSQVTHYFFEGADFYWQPRSSDLAKGKIKFILDHDTPRFHRCATQDYAPTRVHSCADANIRLFLDNCYQSSLFGLIKKKCAPV